MREVRDSFLHFIADNSGLPVHAVRYDPNDPAAGTLAVNQVNIHFLDLDLDQVGRQTAVIDVLNDDENTAVDWIGTLWTILRAAFFTPMFDYTVPASPVAQKSNVMWDRNKVRFRRIDLSDTYCHYSCILDLRFNIS